MAYSRQDRRTPGSSDWGKQQVNYPYGDEAYPQIVETKTARKQEPLPPTASAHPDTARFPTAILCEIHSEAGDNRDNNLWMTYESVPGPWLPYTRRDDNFGPVQGMKRVVRNVPGNVEVLDPTGKTTYQTHDLSDVIAWEMQELWSDGTGSAGNPAYPIGVEDTYDDQKGAVHKTTQATTDLSDPGSLVLSGSTVTQISYEPIPGNPYQRLLITETYSVPGPPLASARPDMEEIKDGVVATTTRTLMALADIIPREHFAFNNWIRERSETFALPLAFQVIESRSIVGTGIEKFEVMEGVTVTVTRTFMTTEQVSPSEAVTIGVYSRVESEPISAEVSVQVITSFPVPGTAVPSTRRDDKLGNVAIQKTIVAATSPIQKEILTATGRTSYEGLTVRGLVRGSTVVLMQTIETWSDGTGTTGNPVYPSFIENEYDNERGDEKRVTIAVADTTSTSSLAINSTIVTEIGYLPFPQNSNLRLKRTRTYTVPGPAQTSKKPDRDGQLITTVKTLKDISTITPDETMTGNVWTRIRSEAISIDVGYEIVESRPYDGTPINTTELDADGDKINIAETFTILSGITTEEEASGSVWTQTTAKPISEKAGWQVVMTRAYDGDAKNSSDIDRDGNVITLARVLTLASGISESEGFDGSGNWKKVYKEEHSKSHLIAFKMTYLRIITEKTQAFQEYNAAKNLLVTGTQKVAPYTGTTTRTTGDEGTVGLSQSAMDAGQALERQFNISEIQAAMAGIVIGPLFEYVNIALPDTLTGITVTYNSNYGNGQDSHPVGQMAAEFAGGGAIGIHPSASAQASGEIIPEIVPAIQSVWSRGLPAVHYFTYMLSANLEQVLAVATNLVSPGKITITISIASPGVVTWTSHFLSTGQTVLLSSTGTLPTGIVSTQIYYVTVIDANSFHISATKGGAFINTSGSSSGTISGQYGVQPLPVFKTGFYTFTAIGQRASVRANADTAVNASANGSAAAASYSWGNGFSQDFGVTVRSIRIGPVINGALSGWTTSQAETFTATVEASTEAITVSGGISVPAITNAPTATSATITGSVSPSSLTATSIPGVPQGGLFLGPQTRAEPDEYGMSSVHIEIVNFGVFA